MKKRKRILSLISMVILLTILSTSIVNANTIELTSTRTNPQDKYTTVLRSRIDALEQENIDAKIPVYIWYKDVNQTEIDKLAERDSGITPKDCEIVNDFPTTSLLRSLEAEDDDSIKEMQNYLENTKQLRKKEKELTSKYKNSRLKISREKYNNKSDILKRELNLDEDNATFSSELAPLIVTEMTVDEIESASKNSNIEEIGYAPTFEVVDPSVTTDEGATAKETLNLTKIYSKLGLTGENVNVGLVEGNIPGPVPMNDGSLEELEIDLNDVTIVETDNNPIIPDINTPSKVHGHSYNTLRVMAGMQTGIAKNINMYATNLNLSNIEKLLTYNIDILVINTSYLIFDKNYYEPTNPDSDYTINTSYAYTYLDKYYDHIISQHNIITVIAGGNWGDHEFDWFNYDEDIMKWCIGARITSPGMAYNAITVGGYNNNNTGENYEDDYLENYSWKNSYLDMHGCEKPDVIMPSNFPGGGTSVGTPALSACIALMIELKPSLSLSPEEVKAIVLASCHRKVIQTSSQGGQETMLQGITERQGAGAPDIWTMVCIVSQGTYGSGIHNGNTRNIDIVQPVYNSNNINFSLTWLTETTATGNHLDYSQVSNSEKYNLSLSVYQNNTLVGNSNLPYSSTELSYIPISNTNNKYQLKINQVSTTANVRYAYAWSTDNMLLSSNSNEGIYYIKNATNNKFLKYNDLAFPMIYLNTITDTNYLDDSVNWILNETDDGYNITVGYQDETGYLSIGDLQSTNSYYAYIDSNEYELNITKNDDGSRTITNKENSKILTDNGDIVWKSYNSETDLITDSEKWYFEKINYLCGDADANGVIDNADVAFVQNYISDYQTATNIQRFLSDANNDGIINIKDSTQIMRIIATIQ